MKIAVVGAGLMGRAVVADLARNKDVTTIGLFDINLRRAHEVKRKYGNRKIVAGGLDAASVSAARRRFAGYDAVISAVTYRYNPGLVKAAIRAKAHFIDMGGNNDIVAEEFKFHRDAKAIGVTVIPDGGLAPGMASVLAASDIAKFGQPESLYIRVGGLPQKPKPPLEYQMVFSAEGLINEMTEPVIALRGGKRVTLAPMIELESLRFRGLGTFEAFTTSGGVSTLPMTYGKVLTNLDYKTIRYPGHCEKLKAILDLGFADDEKIGVDDFRISPRSVLKTMLDKKLSYNEPDMVLVRIITEGKVGGKFRRHVTEIVDYYDKKSGLTAMMRCTAFPVAIIATMMASGKIDIHGVVPQEQAVDPRLFEEELAKRNIVIKRRWSK